MLLTGLLQLTAEKTEPTLISNLGAIQLKNIARIQHIMQHNQEVCTHH